MAYVTLIGYRDVQSADDHGAILGPHCQIGILHWCYGSSNNFGELAKSPPEKLTS